MNMSDLIADMAFIVGINLQTKNNKKNIIELLLEKAGAINMHFYATKKVKTKRDKRERSPLFK